MSTELERTRVYQMSDFPPGTRMLVGDRADLDAMLAQGTVRAVGKFNQLSGGASSVPVVYVSQRAKPFYVRHRLALGITGVLVTMVTAIGVAIMAVGVWWFLGGVLAAATVISILVRYSRGGGRHRVSVTTTTTTNVRVR
jgi:hypothetical protein